MGKQRILGAIVLLGTLFSLLLAGCTIQPVQPIAATAAQALQPGDKIGEMVLTKGPAPFDLSLPVYVHFCNANPALDVNATVAKPGVYTVECIAPLLPELHIGRGWVAGDEKMRDEDWSAIQTELYVNGQLVDQAAFGTLDADVPVQAVPGEDASDVINVKLRVWNVALEHLTTGLLTLRYVWHVDRDLMYGQATLPAGVYDFTYKITVSDSTTYDGTPGPVELVR
jgi:hypothetical protein